MSRQLEALYIDRTQFSDEACQELEQFNLNSLYIIDAPLGNIGAVAIGKIKTLKSLNLDKTNIGDVGIEHLENLAQLEFLSLRNTSVSDKSAKSLARLSNLKTLDLSGTKVTDETMAALKALPLLEELNVARTDVSDTGFAFLDEYPNIKRINVGSTLVHTEVSCNWWLKHPYARVGGKNSRVTSDPTKIDALPMISIMDTLTISTRATTFDNEYETGWGK
jgi:Leucine-rich repeat (LRR) protein